MSETARAMQWLAGRDTGISSKAIMIHMLDGAPEEHSYPSDPADLGRCLRLLALIPEWRGRILEMSAVGCVWAGLARRWDDLEKSMIDEVGIGWEKGRSAPRTYQLMRDIERDALLASPDYEVTLTKSGNLSGWTKKSGGSAVVLNP